MTREYVSPTGSPIIGTVERIPGCALISGINDDGSPVYAGETTVYWDDQRTLAKCGKILFQDEDGEEWTFDQLSPADEEEDEDEDMADETDDEEGR